MNKKLFIFISIIFLLLISSIVVHADDLCSSNSSNLAEYPFCCDALCNPLIDGCQRVLACDSTDLNKVSKAYAVDKGYSIKKTCSECSSLTNVGTCNNIPYADYDNICNECSSYNGIDPAPAGGCYCGTDFAFENEYCCYNNEDGYSVSNNMFNEVNCEAATIPPEPTYYDINGNLQISSSPVYSLPKENFTMSIDPESGENYNINSVGNFEIFNVAEGTYILTLSATGYDNQDCVNCLAYESINVDSDLTLDLDAMCQPTDEDNCNNTGAGTTPPEDECSPDGLCNPAYHSICEDGVWKSYDVTNSTEYNYYCAEDNCKHYDSVCAVHQCIPDDCNGNCPNYCTSSDQDPDCGSGKCDIGVDKWCNSTLGNWMTINDLGEDVYCAICHDPSTCGAFSTCGNGVIEVDEDCDYGNDTWIWGEDSGGQGGCNDIYTLCGQPGTAIECECRNINYICGNDIQEPGEFCEFDENNTGYNCSAGYYCDDTDCSCHQLYSDCNFNVEDVIIGTFLSPQTCTNNISIKVGLNPNCAEYVDTVYVYFSNSWIDSSSEIFNQGGEYYALFNYEVTQPNKEYVFNFGLKFKDDAEILSYSESDSITSGDDFCIDWYNKAKNYKCERGSCSGNSVKNCSSINILEEEDCSLKGEICKSAFGDYGATCVGIEQANLCSLCMGINSMFSFSQRSFTYSGVVDGYYCDDLFSSSFDGVYSCYRDVDYTNVNSPKSCLNVDTCSDYHSEEICGLDPCAKANEDTPCIWNSYNDQTGRGVCISGIDPDCNDALDFTKNNLFLFSRDFNNNLGTSKRICELFGDCYYRFQDSSGTKKISCLNQDELICDYLMTKEDCLGSDLNKFTIDSGSFVNYNYSSNLISNKSKCKWNYEFKNCFRDANDDNKTDERVSQEFNFIKQAGISLQDTPAQRDFISPTTSVNINSMPADNLFGINPTIPFIVYDNLYLNEEDLVTYYCFDNLYFENENLVLDIYNVSSISDKCNPLLDTDDNWFSNKENGLPITLGIQESGAYIIYFLSTDSALNIEEIKALEFEVNNQTPEIDVEYEYETFENIPDYLNNLNISFSVNSYSDTYCEAYLYHYVDSIKTNLSLAGGFEFVSGQSQHFFMEYLGLKDGEYHLNIFCEDQVLGNSINENIIIELQGDTRIFDASPRFKVFKEDELDIELKTHNDGTCYYMKKNNVGDELDLTDMTSCISNNSTDVTLCGQFIIDSQSQGDDYIHFKTLSFTTPYESEVFIYDVACIIDILNNNGEVTQEIIEANGETSPDLIIFSQDYTLPFVNFTIREGNDYFGSYDTTKYYNSPDIKLDCIDEIFYLNNENQTRTFNVLGHELIFGCPDGLFYKQTFGNTCTSPPWQTGLPLTDNLTDPDIGHNENNGGNIVKVCYNAKDNNSNPNISPLVSWDIGLDSIEPGIKSFYISKQSDPDNYVNELSLNIYTIEIVVDEALKNHELKVNVPGEYHVVLNHLYDNNSNTLTATLNVWNIPELHYKDTNITFSIDLEDKHGLFYSNNSCYEIAIDTMSPPGAILEPLFSDYHYSFRKITDILGNDYPIYYRPINYQLLNTYYTNTSEYNMSKMFYSNNDFVHITGYTKGDEYLLVKLLIFDQIESRTNFIDSQDIYQTYDQSLTPGVDEDDVMYEVVTTDDVNLMTQNGTNRIYLNDQYNDEFLDNVNAGAYAKLPIDSSYYHTSESIGKRTAYGNYFKYYRVLNAATDTTLLPGDQVTYLTVEPAVEANVSRNQKLYLYDDEEANIYRDNYFELNFADNYEFACGLTHGTNAYKFKVRTVDSSGLINESAVMNLFIDTKSPELRKIFSANEGTINDQTPLINFIVTEDVCGSGLYLEEFKPEILIYNSDNEIVKTINLNNSNLVSISSPGIANLVQYSFAYQIPNTEPLAEGNYTIGLNIYDYANNNVNNFNWPLNIKLNTPKKPVVDVLNANQNFNPYNKKFFVNSSPIIRITFDEELESISAYLDSGIELNCVATGQITSYDCEVPQSISLENKEYDLFISAKAINKQNYGYWNDTKIVYDTIPPEITGTSLPETMQSISSRVFKIYLEDIEQDIISNISIRDLTNNYLLEDMSSNSLKDEYASYLNSQYFGLVNNMLYNVSIEVFDRAMNYDSITKIIIIDDEAPIINITKFKSGGVTIPIGGNPLNITTRNTTINIEGTVQDLLIEKVCLNSYANYLGNIIEGNSSCKFLCEGNQQLPDCINASGAFEFEFIMMLNPATWGIGEEVWNYITLEAVDVANNRNETTLSALMDWKPPELNVTTIIFS